MQACPREILLERYVRGDTAAGETAEIDAHVGTCSDCRGWLAEARHDDLMLDTVRRAMDGLPGRVPADPPAGSPDAAALARYRVLRRIGEGGMGVVFEAEQKSTRRSVALKVIKPGVVSDRALARFAHEVEALARLHHPGIAQIYEAGTFDAGQGEQPFFAMELVRGVDLIAWVGAERPDVGVRLRLFGAVCDAVQHAHQRGVIHRDLKPANVVVTDAGQPKVLDFGVARATDTDRQRATFATQAGQLIGTLPYMSPEQVTDPDAIDVRADVYALGVLLHELLTGELPIEVDTRSLPDAIRAITDEKPRLPSSVDRSFRGDLDTIVAKALAKEPDLRYPSASDLAADVRRHLSDEPIAARPPSTVYQLRKFARRHRGLCAGALLGALALVTGVVVSLAQASRARAAETAASAERDDARLQAARARSLHAFISDVLIGADPYQSGHSPDRSLREVMDEASRRLASAELDGLDAQPDVTLELHLLIAETCARLGDLGAAERHAIAAHDLARRPGCARALALSSIVLAGIACSRGAVDDTERRYREAEPLLADDQEDDLLRARILVGRSGLSVRRGDFPAAQSAAQAAVELLDGIGAPAVWRANARLYLGDVYIRQDEFAIAARISRDALALYRAEGSGDHPDIAECLMLIGRTARSRDELDDVERLVREAIAMWQRLFGPRDLRLLRARMTLVSVLRRRRQLAAAETEAVDVVAGLRALAPAWRVYLGHALVELAKVRTVAEDFAGSEIPAHEALEIYRALAPGDALWMVDCVHLNAAIAERLGHLDRCGELLDDALRLVRERNVPDPSAELGRTLNALGVALQRVGRFDESEDLLRRALAIRQQVFGADSAQVGNTWNNIGRLLQSRGDPVAAEEPLRRAVEISTAQNGEQHEYSVFFAKSLAVVLLDLDRVDEAETLLRRCASLAEGLYPAGHWRRSHIDGCVARCLVARGTLDEAEPRLLECLATVEQAVGRRHAAAKDLLDGLVQLYRARGDEQRARRYVWHP